MNLEEFVEKVENKGIIIKSESYANYYGYCLNFYYRGCFLRSECLSDLSECEGAYKRVTRSYKREFDSRLCQALIRSQGLTKALEKYGDSLVYSYDFLGVLSDFKETKKGFKCLDTDGVTRRFLRKDKINQLETSCWRVWAN